MGQGDGQEVEWIEALVEGLRHVHDELIHVGGGMLGERTASLFAAAARPYQTFDGELLYSDPYQRAAALFHGIICDHAFTDGNKRTGTLAAIFVLFSEQCLVSEDFLPLHLALLGQVALEAAQGNLTVEQVTHWIRRIFEPKPSL
jgi:death-on-curing protein